MENYNEHHREKFTEWRKDRNIQETSILTTLKVGDRVTFTNDNGVIFRGHTVLGFDLIPDNGRFIYLDYDCYWFAAKEMNLKKE